MPSKKPRTTKTPTSSPTTSPATPRPKLIDRTNDPLPEAFQFIGLERPRRDERGRSEGSGHAPVADAAPASGSKIVVSLDEFELDFIPRRDPVELGAEDDDVEYDVLRELDKMQDAVPRNALEFGPVEEEVDGFAMSTMIEIYFYVIPWKSDGFEWALFGINWDDAYEQWQWESYARASGTDDGVEAARAMLSDLFFKHWNIDFDRRQSQIFRSFLATI